MIDGVKTKKKMEKPKYNMWQNTVYMVKLALKNKKSVLVLCVLVACFTLFESLINLFVAPTILNKIETKSSLFSLLFAILFFSVALLIIKGVSSYLDENVIFGRIYLRTLIDGRVHKKFMTTSFPNTENTAFLERLERVNSALWDNNGVPEAIWGTFSTIILNISGFVIYLILLSSLEPLLVIVTIVTTVIGYFASKKINEWGYRHRSEEDWFFNRMNYLYRKSQKTDIAKDVRLFGMRGWLEDIYFKTLKLYQSFVAKGEKIYIWANIIDMVLAFLRNGVAYVYLIIITVNEGLSASEFLLYLNAASGFTAWVSGILDGFSALHSQSVNLSLIREFFDIPEQFKFEDGESLEPDLNKKYEIRLNNVSFKYPGADEYTLKNINLTINPGENLAIVGLNGAGKTTLVKLICGFYDPTEGEVLLNGEDIRKFNRRDYYRHFSAVFQKFSVLEATLAENISQLSDDIDMDKVKNCAEKSGISKKADMLEKGYDTYVSYSVYEDRFEPSGGELQRLMLARALYKDAPIILLDEPTAALDPIAENEVYRNYSEMTSGRTSVYISHRLASTRFCDRIIYLEGGNIAEEGTHDELLLLHGKYSELFNIQSYYYKEGVEF